MSYLKGAWTGSNRRPTEPQAIYQILRNPLCESRFAAFSKIGFASILRRFRHPINYFNELSYFFLRIFSSSALSNFSDSSKVSTRSICS